MRCDVMLVCWIGCSWLVEVLEGGPWEEVVTRTGSQLSVWPPALGRQLHCGASGMAGHSKRIRWEALEESLKIVCIPPDMKGGGPVTGQYRFFIVEVVAEILGGNL